jgi:hypothetical protein
MGKASPLILSLEMLTVVDNRSSSRDIPGGAGLAASSMRVRSGPVPLNRMEVTVHTEYEQYAASQMGRYVGTDTRGQYKTHEVTLYDDVESGPEK